MNLPRPSSKTIAWSFCLISLLITHDSSLSAEFDRVVIDADFPAGYQVEVADVNGDGRPDIVALGGGTCAWYENPSWTKRRVTGPKQTPGIISSATADLDGDGKAEVAIAYEFAMTQPKRGKLGLAVQGSSPDGPWTFTTIADVPSIHRLRWGDVDLDKRLDLVVAPIFGPDATPPTFDQDPARLVYYRTGADPKAGMWTAVPVGERPVMHAIDLLKRDNGSVTAILTADNRGVGMDYPRPSGGLDHRDLVPGAPGNAPKRGSSEVHRGTLKDGRHFIATIDPWHGSEVAVCVAEKPASPDYKPRVVIDDTLADGHALWVADVDSDGDDEVFAGHRGTGYRVSMYDFDGKAWTRTVLDDAVAAQDLRGGDLDGDGTPDVVTIGGKTHNVVWYRFKANKRPHE
jgi:hypothetical protein